MKLQPAWLRAQREIERMIASAPYQPSDKIPSERALAEVLGLSRMTVRQAVENLVRGGVLERDSTSGTRVARTTVRRVMDSRHAFSMSQQIRSSGAEPGSRLISFAYTSADKAIAERLGIKLGARIVVTKRLRTANGVPVCVETSYLPAERVPGFAAADLRDGASLYSVLESRYGIRPAGGQGEISASPVDTEAEELLGLGMQASALVWRSVALDEQGQPVEYVVSVNHPERVTFATEHNVARGEGGTEDRPAEP